jgi:YHS domain-containing protein
MKFSTILLAFTLSVGAHLALGADSPPNSGGGAAQAAKDSAWLDKARVAYPLTTCVVSGEDLGDMADAKDYIYQQEGKPDRLVRFCCAKCLSRFEKDPAKYLKLIDEASAKAAKR